MGRATEDLRHEHEAILHVLGILGRANAADGRKAEAKLKFYEELVYFLTVFADRCHHGKEEGHLFPALVGKGVADEGGPVGAMLAEHRLGREYIAAMKEALAAGDAEKLRAAGEGYGGLLQAHIGKENNVLFPMADRLLGAKAQDALFEKFEKHEEQVIGHGVHERLHAMIDRWAAEYP